MYGLWCETVRPPLGAAGRRVESDRRAELALSADRLSPIRPQRAAPSRVPLVEPDGSVTTQVIWRSSMPSHESSVGCR